MLYTTRRSLTASPLISMLLINTFALPPPLKAPFPSPVLILVLTPTAAPPFATLIPILASPLTQSSTPHTTMMANYTGEMDSTANTPAPTTMQKKFYKTQLTKSSLQAKLSKRKERRIQPLRPSLKRQHPMSSLKRCFKCKAMGHIRVHCPYKIRPMLRRK